MALTLGFLTSTLETVIVRTSFSSFHTIYLGILQQLEPLQELADATLLLEPL